MLHLDTPMKELCEVAALLVIIALSWQRNRVKPLTVGFGLWCSGWLLVDVFLWHCVRPWYVQDVFNACNVLGGLFIIYENGKKYLVAGLVFLLSLVR